MRLDYYLLLMHTRTLVNLKRRKKGERERERVLHDESNKKKKITTPRKGRINMKWMRRVVVGVGVGGNKHDL